MHILTNTLQHLIGGIAFVCWSDEVHFKRFSHPGISFYERQRNLLETEEKKHN